MILLLFLSRKQSHKTNVKTGPSDITSADISVQVNKNVWER